MKKRIIALLTALLCFSTLLVGCDKEIPPCDTHVDADQNNICDGCKRAVIVIETELPYEEPVVDMVVKPVPDVNFMDFKAPEEEDLVLSGTVKALDIEGTVTATANDGKILLIKNSEVDDPLDPQEYTATVTVYDAVADQTLYTKTETYTAADLLTKNTYDAFVSDDYYVITEGVYDSYLMDYEYTYTYKNYANEVIYTGAVMRSGIEKEQGVTYMYFGNDVVALDEDMKVIHETTKNFLVKRPEFDFVTDNYGIVEMNGKLLVYDLSQWIDCVYSYTVPTDYTNVKMFLLGGDVMLIQAYEALDSAALNFDLEDQGTKYDLHYLVVDFAQKAVTEQEFGYLVTDVDLDVDGMTESVKNIVTACEINDKAVDTKAVRTFAVDSKMDILFEIAPVHIAQENNAFDPVAEDLYLINLKYADSTTVDAIVDKDGNFKNYLPRNYDVVLGLLNIEGVLYDWTLNEVFDYTEEGYTFVAVMDSYAMLSKTVTGDEGDVTTYYFYDGVNAPVLLTSKPYDANDYGYVLKAEAEGVVTYTLYNAANQKVADFDAIIYSIDTVDEEAGVFKITTENGVSYVR